MTLRSGERGRERGRERERTCSDVTILRLLILTCRKSSQKARWAEVRTLHDFLKDPHVRMNSSSKSANSAAIKGEIKRHESLQNTINRLSKQLERVSDQQLRAGLKVYLHSVQGRQMVPCGRRDQQPVRTGQPGCAAEDKQDGSINGGT